MNDLEAMLRRHRPYDFDRQRHRTAQRAALLTAFGTPVVASAASAKAAVASTAASSTGSGSSTTAIAVTLAACLLLGGSTAWWALQGPLAARPLESGAQAAASGVASESPAAVTEPTLTAMSGRFTTQFFRNGKLVVSLPGWFEGAVSRTGKPGGYSVMNGDSHVVLEVSDAERRAVRYRMSPPANDGQARQVARYGGGLIGSMRWMLDPKNRSYFETPKAKRGGVRREVIKQRTPQGTLVGVRMTSPAMSSTVLASPQGGTPERFEVILGSKPDNKIVVTDFQFGIAVDPVLLSTEPPEGYQFEDQTGANTP